MQDRVFGAFLNRQREDALALLRESDRLAIAAVTPQHFAVRFRCRGLVQEPRSRIVEADDFSAGIFFPGDYLRFANPFQVVTWFYPAQIFHPNISDTGPFICIGRLLPGTPLVDIIHQVHQIITYNKVTMREDDALNKVACVWARSNTHRFPVDTRPLKRKALDLQIEVMDRTEAL